MPATQTPHPEARGEAAPRRMLLERSGLVLRGAPIGARLRMRRSRHCERSEAIQAAARFWIASSLSLLAMTTGLISAARTCRELP